MGAILGAALTESACLPAGRSCSPGDYLQCTCSSGQAGAQVCADDGSGYAACDCTLLDSGLVPDTGIAVGDAAADGTGASDTGVVLDAGLCSAGKDLPITCACTDNTQCHEMDCHTFPSKGPRCTRPCTKDSDCTPLSPGCAPMGYCRAPS